MKNLLVFSCLIFMLSTFISCDDEVKQCRKDMEGNYTGSGDCGTENTIFEVGNSDSGKDGIRINIVGSFGLEATVDDECNIIIPFQTLIFDDGSEATYAGSGTYNVDNLNFTFEQDILGTEEGDGICEFSISK